MIGLQGCASRSESNRSAHLYKLASQRTTKALIRLCVSWITRQLILHLSLSKTKQTKWHVRAAKTQDSLGIRTVWSEALCAVWVAHDLNFRQSDSEDSDQTERMPRLIWVFALRTGHFADHFITKTASLFLITSTKVRTFEHCGLPLNFTFEWVHYNWINYQMLPHPPHSFN